jgi:AraC-like DNA-binding protein
MSVKMLYIKNMVCNRCVLVVNNIIDDLRLSVESIEMGRIKFLDKITHEQMQHLKIILESFGFELVEDKRAKLVEAIKIHVIKFINEESINSHINLSEYLGSSLHYDYNYLSSTFAAVENISIERFLISHKIEKIKELMFVDDLSLTEISYQLGYSSLSHLSAQFKKVTGFTPSQYRKQNDIACRNSLDHLKIM